MRLVLGLILIVDGVIAIAEPAAVFHIGYGWRKKAHAEPSAHCCNCISASGSICVLIGIMACIAHFIA